MTNNNASGDELRIKLALSGQESWKSYREAMAQARIETARLKQDLKEIAALGKAFEAHKIFSTPGGFDRAVSGQTFQGQQRAKRQMDMGLPGMQELSQARELLRLSAQLLKTFDSLGVITAANRVKLGESEAELRKITTLAETKNRLDGVQLQLTSALQVKDGTRIADLTRQRDILKEHTQHLTNEMKAQEALQKQAEREESRIQKQRDSAKQSGIKQEFDAIRKAEEDKVRAAQQTEDRIQKQREAAKQAGVKQDFDAIRKAEDEKLRAATQAEDRIQKQRDAANRAGIKQDFDAVRKAEDDKVRAAQQAEDRIQKQREAAKQAGLKQEFDAIHKAEADKVKAEQQSEARIQKQRENAAKAGIKQDFDAVRKAEEDKVREAERAELRIQKQRENAAKAGVKQEFDAIRKAEDEKVRVAQQTEDRIQRQRKQATDAETLRNIKDAYKDAAAPETAGSRKANASFREYMAGAIRQRAEMIQLDRTELDIWGQIGSQYEAGLEKAALLNRIRQAGQAGMVEDVHLLEKQLKVVNQIQQKMSKQPAKSPEAAAADQRHNTLNRLFGDGGATLMAVQSGISMNYAVMNAVQGAVTGAGQFALEFDTQMREVQAITVTTDANMTQLKKTIFDVSAASKFMATDVADATMILGQAGLSTSEIQQSLAAITTLAAATGTDLKQSVDIATSVIGVFEISASQMGQVANTLTSAVNMSKLNIDKLALGLQYAGNTAAQSGVSFEELTATLGAMSNAGIRSGSTLGTGMRQILIALEKPSKDFRETLDRLGISMADINIRTNGLYGVLKNLKEGGFTAGDAMRSFEVRAAAAFNAATTNLPDIVAMERAFLNQASAQKATETQMRSLSNQYAVLKSNLGTLVSVGLEPVMLAMRDALKWASSVFQTLQKYPNLLRGVTTAFIAIAASLATLRAGFMLVNFVKVQKDILLISTGIKTATGAISGLNAALGVIGLLSLAITVGYAAWSSYSDEVGRASDAVQKAQTAFDNANGAMEETKTQLDAVDGKLADIANRSDVLAGDQNLLNLETEKVAQQFSGMGIKLDSANTSADGLIESLRALRTELAEKYIVDIEIGEKALATLIAANNTKLQILQNSMPSDAQIQLWAGKNSSATNAGLLARAKGASTNGTVENQGLLSDINARLSVYEAAALEGVAPGALSAEQGSLEALQAAQATLQEMVNLQNQQVSLQRQYNDLQIESENVKNRLANPVMDKRVLDLTTTAEARVSTASKTGTGAVEQFQAANAETQLVEAEGKQLKDDIAASTSINNAVKETLTREIDEAIAASAQVRDDLLATAQEVVKDNEKATAQLQAAKEQILGLQMDKATTEGDVNTISAARSAMVEDTYDAGLTQLEVDTKGDTSSQAYIAGLESLRAAREVAQAKIRAEAQAKLGEILKQGQAATENVITDLETQIKATGALEFAKRKELYNKMEILIGDKADQEAAIVEATITNVTDKKNALDAIRAAEKAALLDLTQTQQQNDVDAAQDALKQTDDALAAVEALAVKTTTLAGLVALAKKAMALIAQRATQAAALADADPGDTITPDSTSSDQAGIEAKWTKLLAQWKKNVVKYGNAGGAAFGDGGGGGGGGSKKSPEDLMVEQMDQRVKSVEALLKAKLIDGATGVTRLTDYMKKAKEDMVVIDAKIAAMQSQVSGGQMDAKSLEHLNDLLKAREELTKQQIAAEQLLSQEYVKQGNYFAAASVLSRNWATENLDVAKTFQQGFENVLSTMTSGFAQLFTDLVSGTKSAGEAFRDFAGSVVKSLLQMISQMIAVYIMQKLIGMVFPGAQAPGSIGAIAQQVAGITKMTGGAVRKAGGGAVEGNVARDSQLHNLMPGEYVLRKSAVDAIGLDELDKMNAMGNRAMAGGGHVGVMDQKKGPIGQTNVYVVSPDQQPIPGPSDIIAIINDDIARGGSTKKLIKTVAMGY